MARDNFPYSAPGVYNDAYDVVPSDTEDLNPRPQALWVGGAGDLVVEMPSGVITLTAVPAGVEIKLRAIKVMEASTATLIVALGG